MSGVRGTGNGVVVFTSKEKIAWLYEERFPAVQLVLQGQPRTEGAGSRVWDCVCILHNPATDSEHKARGEQ